MNETSRPPNLLLITTDQQRWDTLGCANDHLPLHRAAAAVRRYGNHLIEDDEWAEEFGRAALDADGLKEDNRS